MDKSIERLKRTLEERVDRFRGIPFWSWNNDVKEEILLRQIDDMKSAGLGGFILHARTGLKLEYLGEAWFSCVGACLRRARELGMEVWIYDENGWPSGFAGGKLLENERYLARFLTYSVRSSFDKDAFCVFVKDEKHGFRRIREEEEGESEYHTVSLHISPSNTDILDPEVVDAFIGLTHEQYYRRFRESFGRELKGFFTDEPQYYRYATPYSHAAEAVFSSRYREDIRDGLIWLFVHDERGYPFRTRYYSLLHELYTENFYGRVFRWCNEHGCELCGHSFEESSVSAQMLGSAGVMLSYAREHIPTIDWLGRYCGETELSPKQAGSVASQLQKERVLTESFACSGYDATPAELKSIAEFQFFCGINLLCHHLFPYSLSAQGKSDHPPVFSRHGNWWEQFSVFNEYFARLGCIVGSTEEVCEVAVIHPMRSAYLEYVRSEGGESLKELDDSFHALLLSLRKCGIQYQLVDEGILAEYGRAEGALVVGKRRYSRVIVPKMASIARTTYDILKSFQGKLYLCGTPSFIDGVPAEVALSSDCTFGEIAALEEEHFRCEDGNTMLTVREGECGRFVFLKNLSAENPSRAYLKDAPKRYRTLDLETLALGQISEEIELPPNGSVVLIASDAAVPPAREGEEEDVTSSFRTAEISPNFLVIDHAQAAKEGEEFGRRLPLSGLFEELLRENYRGRISVRQTFVLRARMPLTLVLEREKYCSVQVNGHELSFSPSAFDPEFAEADLTAFVREGENELLYTLEFYQHEGVRFALFDPAATESVRNCLYFDTHLENGYLKGRFTVEKDFSLSPERALPPVSAELPSRGYPFFKGTVTLEGTIGYDGVGRRKITVGGRYLVATVEANGEKEELIFGQTKEITRLLRRGDNKVRITLRSGLRNLFGPHHFRGAREPMCVNPYMFTQRGSWEKGTSPDYTEEYCLVPFGAECIKITKF